MFLSISLFDLLITSASRQVTSRRVQRLNLIYRITLLVRFGLRLADQGLLDLEYGQTRS